MEASQARKIPLIFYRLAQGQEPVREWLRELPAVERQAIGSDLLRAQWPAGMPLCRPLGDGLWEVRTDLPTKRTARVLLCHSPRASGRAAWIYKENTHGAG